MIILENYASIILMLEYFLNSLIFVTIKFNIRIAQSHNRV